MCGLCCYTHFKTITFMHLSSLDRHRYGTSLNGSLDTSTLLNNGLSLSKLSPGHGINDLSYRMKQELDRSISKHLEKGGCMTLLGPGDAYPLEVSVSKMQIVFGGFRRRENKYGIISDPYTSTPDKRCI